MAPVFIVFTKIVYLPTGKVNLIINAVVQPCLAHLVAKHPSI